MKFQKLNSKQAPQVLVLGVLCAGVLGYALYTSLVPTGTPADSKHVTKVSSPAASGPSGPSGPSGAVASASGSAPSPAGGAPSGSAPGVQPASPGAGGAAGTTAASVPGAQPVSSSAYNPDPFRPAVNLKPDAKPAAKPAEKATSVAKSPGGGDLSWPGGPLPSIGSPAQGSAPVQISTPVPPPPPAPVRPDVSVTGIIAAEDAPKVALVQLGSEHRTVEVGDTVANDYQVRRIAMDGILLVNKEDRYFVSLGNKKEHAAAAR